MLSRVMDENLGGIRVVRAFAAQEHEMAKFDRASKSALELAHERVDLRVTSTSAMNFSFFLAMGLVLALVFETYLLTLSPIVAATERVGAAAAVRLSVRAARLRGPQHLTFAFVYVFAAGGVFAMYTWYKPVYGTLALGLVGTFLIFAPEPPGKPLPVNTVVDTGDNG